MANEQPTEAKSKRRVKNPETFRERALKAAEVTDKPERVSIFKRLSTKLIAPVARSVGRLLRKIFYRQPFKFIGKIIFPTYFRNSWRELKLVTWPTKRQSRQLTFAVLVFAVIFGSTIALVDYGLDKVFRHLLLK